MNPWDLVTWVGVGSLCLVIFTLAVSMCAFVIAETFRVF